MEITMKELYRLIDSLDMNRKHELVTVTGGAHAGLKLLLTDGEVIWSSDPACSDIPEKARPESVFRERLTHAVRLVVCGCGYVGQSVIRLAKFLGWNVTALDDREEFVSMARLAGADEVICGPFGETIPKTASYSSTCYVVVTREHRYDRECLDAILAREPGYVGMMGSHTRSDRMRQSLAESGVDKEKIARIHAPVGLEIGAVTPQEIAVSIIAQIMQEKAKFLQGSAFPPDLMAALKEEGPDGSHAILALITAQRGSTPREAGARMLVYPDGKTVGTIGGGLMEAEVIRRALQSLEDPSSFRPYTITIDMSGRPGSMKDMVCGGVTDVFLELL